MLLVECHNLKKYFADRLIVELENLRIYAEDRIGIVGVNGAGKTTLLKILSQKLAPDDGWVKSYGKCAFISQLEAPESNRVSPEMASKFGVAENWDETMSGGEKTRFKLAAGFEKDSSLIFADEPTSNIDINGIELLENRFEVYNGGLVLISHDRSFLDKLCSKILEIEGGKVTLYHGNYSDYSKQKAKKRKRSQFEYQQYVNEKKRLEDSAYCLKQKSKSIKRAPKRMGNSEARLHRMGGQKANSTLERARKNIEARIEHLEVREKPVQQEKIKLDVAQAPQVHSKTIIKGNKINKAFADKVIFADAEFKIYNGSKVAFIGANGCGKSTLLKIIMAKGPCIKIAPAAKIGYFSQDMNILVDDLTILENVLEGSIYPETYARILLSRLLLKREDVYKRVSVLSGGERVKASFAKILLKDINLLILDEPTNYLDIISLEVVEEALRDYEGTLLFVSHDRRLIGAVADSIMTVDDHKINVFKGSYEEYLAHIAHPVTKGTADIEKQILLLQHRLTEIVGRLSMPTQSDNLVALDQEYHQVLCELKELKAVLNGAS